MSTIAKNPTSVDVEQAQAEADELSQMQKAAIIIAILGPEIAKPLVDTIDEKQMRSFITAMMNLSLVPRHVILATVADFISLMNERQGSLRGGRNAARKMAENFMDSDRVSELFPTAAIANPTNEAVAGIWDKLAKEKSDKIADYLNTQRSEVVNIVLSNMTAAKAGEILGAMDPEAAKNGGYLMADGSNADDDTLAAIAEVIQIELLTEGGGEENGNAASFMAELMGVLPRGRRDEIMDVIEENNPAQAERIRKGLLTFEDLPARLPKSAIPMIFRDMDGPTLVKALKAGDESDPMVTGFLYGNISQRMAEQFKDDVAAHPNLTEKDGEAAVIALMTYITGLERDGAIALIAPSEAAPSMANFEMDMNLDAGADEEEGE